MKKIFIPIIALFFLSSCVISGRSHMPFVKRSDLSHNAKMISIHMPLALAKPFIIRALKEDGSYGPEIAAIIRKIRSVEVLTVQGNTSKYDRQEAYFKNNNYEELASIINDGSRVRLMAKTNDNFIKNLYVLVKDDENMVYVSVKGKLKYADIETLINAANKDEDDAVIAGL